MALSFLGSQHMLDSFRDVASKMSKIDASNMISIPFRFAV
jgi:hypothetical protein